MKKVIIISLILIGCATTSNISKIKPGMTQDEVTALCGNPISREFDENTTAWLYDNLNSFNIITGLQIRYYWVIFYKNNVIAVKDAGAKRLSSPSSGMSFLCKDAIASGDEGGIFIHCQ